MMLAPLSKEVLEAFACPGCQGQLVLTQERLLFCRACLLGFRIHGEVPDLGLSRAVSFKKALAARGGGTCAVLTMVVGKAATGSLTVEPGHCVMLGRLAADDAEVTMVGRAGLPTALDDHTRRLIEKYVSKNIKGASAVEPVATATMIGCLKRDPDFLLDDTAVSRRHALLYQDGEGLWILDLVSKNGTFVHGKEVENQRLKNNDVVSLGGASLRVVI
jgi:uncharacterized protein YbaR (Trm112 family)